MAQELKQIEQLVEQPLINYQSHDDPRAHMFYIENSKHVNIITNSISTYYLDLFKYTYSLTVENICTFKQVNVCLVNDNAIYYDYYKLFITGDDGPAIEISINPEADVYNLRFVMTYINWMLPANRFDDGFEFTSEQMFDIIKSYKIPMISLEMQERILADISRLNESIEYMLTVVENCVKTSADGWGAFSLYGHVSANQLKLKQEMCNK